MKHPDRVSRFQRLKVDTPQGASLPENGVLSHDGRRIQCHLCHRWYISLASHIRQTHHTTADEYREEFGLNRHCPLVAPTLSLALSRANYKRWPDGTPPVFSPFLGQAALSHKGTVWAVREETKRSISAANLGKPGTRFGPNSPETRAKISQALKGRTPTLTARRLAAQRRNLLKTRKTINCEACGCPIITSFNGRYCRNCSKEARRRYNESYQDTHREALRKYYKEYDVKRRGVKRCPLPLTPDEVKELRLAKRWSQRELAAQLGISQVLVSQWERGLRQKMDKRTAATLQYLAEKVGAPRGSPI